MSTSNREASLLCPVCAGADLDALYPEYEGACITSDYAVLAASALANRCCRRCGLVFNARGTRGDTEAFYRDSYSLMLRKETSAIQSFTGPQPMSQAEKSLQVLLNMSPLPAHGRLLEVGAGKGEFLGHFLRERPNWEVVALEPSAAVDSLRTIVKSGEVRRGGYLDYSAEPGTFDLVVALGVLEHVENPLDMVARARDALKPGGIFFVRVPNFARNPNDLFCADHLSKLTLPTLRSLARAAGFEVIGELEEGVPVFIALRKSADAPAATPGNAYSENISVARSNAAVAAAGVKAVLDARAAAQARGERFAIFGLGASGLFAPLYAGFPASDIAAYIDENRTIWGTEVHGRRVGGLDLINELGIKHVALAVSPVYIPKIREKLTPLGVAVYAGA
jgi:SAM-dependent methyltransferase